MFSTYLRVAARYLKKDKLYTFINLTGLSIGIACCLIIFLFAYGEFRYDRFHKKTNNIYRLTTVEINESGSRPMAHSYIPMAPLLQSQFADVRQVVRILPHSASVANKEENIVFQEEQFFFADSNFFRLFSFQLSRGNIQTALSNPDDIVISEAVAKRYFGKQDPIGKQLMVDNKLSFKVAGVLEELPANSSIRFEFLVPFRNAGSMIGEWVFNNNKNWYYPTVYSFMEVDNSAVAALQSGMNDFEKKFLPDHVAKQRSHQLQPLTDIHFSVLENELLPGASKKTVYIFIAIAMLILFIAAINFINLFLSRILQRLRGVGIRKVIGATNRHIWWQTAAESLVFLVLSLLLSALWLNLFLPGFNAAMSMNISAFSASSLIAWFFTTVLILLISVCIALFPSRLLWKFRVVNILKGETASLFPRKRTFSLQSSLVIFQFTIAIILITSTIIINSQIHYIQNKDLGLQKEQTLVIPIRDESLQENFMAIKNQLAQISGVSGVSAISNFPWVKGFYDFQTTITSQGKQVRSNAYTLLVDEDFIHTMGMQMKQGRSFSKDYGKDGSTAFIINESAAEKFGIASIDGVKLVMENVASGQPKQGELIGIVKNFHLQSLHHPVEPLILTVSPASYYIDNIVVKIAPGSVVTSLNNIEAAIKKTAPDRPFDYFFMDEAFDKLYRKETRLASVFNYFSALAIIISCLGLFGIAAITSVQRAKEIGIRKVLGATVSGVVALLSRDFLKLVLIASIPAFPVAWYMMHTWLEDFAYRINISWWAFGIAAAIVVLVALATVSFQAIKAAIVNPVKSLRTE